MKDLLAMMTIILYDIIDADAHFPTVEEKQLITTSSISQVKFTWNV